MFQFTFSRFLGRSARVSGLLGLSVIQVLAASAVWATDITILHTNDLHSRFRPETDALKLGGIARIKTAIDRIKATRLNTFVVDGGDWSEGSIYYTQEGGAESLRMMDKMGYDVAVVGNHDWINGPDSLLGMLHQSKPKMELVSANLQSDEYEHIKEFKRLIPPYVIRKVDGVKIAFVGLSTYEYIYDKFVAPLKVLKPKDVLQELVPRLKSEGASVVVVISHNSIKTNRSLLADVPGVDLIIGAHDHQKLLQPIAVERSGGRVGWLVEVGSWGRYMGRVDLKVKSGVVELSKYRVLQINSSIPEDPEINQELDQMEARIEEKFGPIFRDQVGECQTDLNRLGIENRMGNFVTDAYLKATGADFALDSTKFVYGEIHHGSVRTVDLFNANPAVYNHSAGKTWTLRTVPISGRLLKWFLYATFLTKTISSYGLVNGAGIEFTFDPFFAKNNMNMSSMLDAPAQGIMGFFSGIQNVTDIKIQGQDLESNRMYNVATGGGIIEGIEFFNSYSPFKISLEGVQDTGQENWRVLKDYFASLSPLTPDKVTVGDRVRTKQSDVGVLYDDVQWEPIMKTTEGMVANIRVKIRNYGMSESPVGFFGEGPVLRILQNKNGTDYSSDPDYVALGEPHPIRSMTRGDFEEYVWQEVTLPEHNGIYEVTAQISGNDHETNHTNDLVTRYFRE